MSSLRHGAPITSKTTIIFDDWLPTTLQLPLSIRHVVSSHGFAHSFHFFPKRRSHLLCHVLVDAGAQQRLDRVGCPPIDAVFRTQITIADVSTEIRLSKTHYP
jgi:hypothetical protein